MLNTIDEGIKAVRQGKIVIVVDDENRENEGDFIVSGEKITPDIVNFMITHGRGLLCVPLPRSRCEELQLYPMSEDNTSLLGTPFTMSVERKNMSGTCQFRWFYIASNQSAYGSRTVIGRNPRCTAVALQVDRHGERSAQKRSVVFRHRV